MSNGNRHGGSGSLLAGIRRGIAWLWHPQRHIVALAGAGLVAGAGVAAVCVLLIRGCSPVQPQQASTAGPTSRPYKSSLPPMRRPHVLVEKSLNKLTVFDGDLLIKTYRVATGRGKGDKVKEGDGCTPEGVFYVCMHNPESLYHLALGLSYPNVEDADRGLRDELISQQEHDQIVAAVVAKRTPPWKTRLGGEIMIHGNGAERGDGTAGCVGMNDADVEELYVALPDGTEVKIVP